MASTITPHQARTAWCMRQFGANVEIHRRRVEVSDQLLGVMEFRCRPAPYCQAEHWVYATNGISGRRMPWREGPTVPPELRHYRVELLGCTRTRTAWVVDLLEEMARYPFLHGTGFAYGQTIPVDSLVQQRWERYVLGLPPNHEAINPLGVVAEGLGGDPVLWLQVIGLKRSELATGIERGGDALLKTLLATSTRAELLFLDSDRTSLISGEGKNGAA